MAKAIMLSIRPKYVSMILNKTKTIEVRKRFPKDYKGWVYIYCTKDSKMNFVKECWTNSYTNFAKEVEIGNSTLLNGKIVARFYCDKVEEIYGMYDELGWNYEFKNEEELLRKSCLDNEDLGTYLKICNNNDFQKVGYAIHISNLEIFDKPKELSEFKYPKPSICGIKDKNGLYQCDKCKYGYSEFMHCECRLPLTKAPQSFCYVEVDE